MSENPVEPSDPVCGEVAEACICVLAPHGPETPHHCTHDGCGGMWLGTIGQVDFQPVRFPETASIFNPDNLGSDLL